MDLPLLPSASTEKSDKMHMIIIGLLVVAILLVLINIFKSKEEDFAEEPYADEPYGEEPYADEPYGKEPYADEPFGEEPFADEPFGEEPFGEEPFADEPFGEEPFGEEPFADEPYGEEPFAEEPFNTAGELGYVPLQPKLSVGDGTFSGDFSVKGFPRTSGTPEYFNYYQDVAQTANPDGSVQASSGSGVSACIRK